MASKVYLDSDVILDFLMDRNPFAEFSANLFTLREKGKLELYTSALIVNNIHYVLRKLIGSKEARDVIRELLLIIHCVEVNQQDLQTSVDSEFSDFEDGIQYACALKVKGLNAILTRNIRDYRRSQIAVYDPKDFLKLI